MSSIKSGSYGEKKLKQPSCKKNQCSSLISDFDSKIRFMCFCLAVRVLCDICRLYFLQCTLKVNNKIKKFKKVYTHYLQMSEVSNLLIHLKLNHFSCYKVK